MFAPILRPDEITVQAQNLEGKNFILSATGLLARVIQHENDHLNGVLFIDRMGEEDRKDLVAEYEKKGKKGK
jgi:peptide deformylase